jgi:cytochrome oxidase Cu insertion factor (SCO1/SenC/PrrC family)
VAAVTGALIGLALHLADEPQGPSALTLPSFHGQGHWGAAERRAPDFRFQDQAGATVSLSAQRGKPVLIAFVAAGRADGSDREAASLAQALALVPSPLRPVIDLISLDPRGDTPARIRAAARRWGLRPPFHWLTGSPLDLARTAREYGVGGEPPPQPGASENGTPLYLVNREGFERAGYLVPFFPTVLASDIERLHRESG